MSQFCSISGAPKDGEKKKRAQKNETCSRNDNLDIKQDLALARPMSALVVSATTNESAPLNDSSNQTNHSDIDFRIIFSTRFLIFRENFRPYSKVSQIFELAEQDAFTVERKSHQNNKNPSRMHAVRIRSYKTNENSLNSEPNFYLDKMGRPMVNSFSISEISKTIVILNVS